MKRLLRFPLPVATAFLSLVLIACNGGGGSDGGPGGSDIAPFCETDVECAAGATNECSLATCDLIDGVCVTTPLPEASPCDDNNGVCRDGFCAQTELNAYIKSPSPEPNAFFGTAVSIRGDRMIVGAPSSGPPFGRVAVFERANDQWTVAQQIETPRLPGGSYECTPCEELACPTMGEGDGFGVTLAISGNTLVVGAPGEASADTGVNGDEGDNSAPGAGAATSSSAWTGSGRRRTSTKHSMPTRAPRLPDPRVRLRTQSRTASSSVKRKPRRRGRA